MFRVVLDTNVIISALCFSRKSLPSEVLRLGLTEKYELVLSPAILLEAANKLREKFDWNSSRIERLIKLLGNSAKIVKPKLAITEITDDPDDNKVLECAIKANAHFIVTGDKHLLQLEIYKNVNIITPATFLNLFKK